MPTTRVANNSTSTSGTPLSSSTAALTLPNDDYGTVVVIHGGARLASTAAATFILQGSMDGGTSWADLESMKPSDISYVNGELNSWVRVVPLLPTIRLRVLNTTGSSITGINCWVVD